jgi:hypothetical protein
MKRQRLSGAARALTLTAVFVLAAPGSALAPLLYLCSMSNAIGPKCCCNHAQAPDHQAPAAGNVSCCTTVSDAAASAVTIFSGHSGSLELPLFHAPSQPSRGAGLSQRITTPLGPRAPPPDQPLFKVHCAYLI